jgi:hypothetical protein
VLFGGSSTTDSSGSSSHDRGLTPAMAGLAEAVDAREAGGEEADEEGGGEADDVQVVALDALDEGGP